MAFDPVRTLGDVVTLVRGTTYKSAQLGQPGPVLLGLGTIQRNGGFRADSLKTYGGDSKEKLLLRPGDIYVSLKDVTQSADLLGAVARVPETIALGRLTQDTVKLEFIDQSYPRSLVYWALRSPEFRAYCRAHATGTTNLGLAREDFLAFELPEPDEELLSLVELLESLDARIDLLCQSNATLEAIAQALFKSWFVDFDPVRAKAEGREPEGVDSGTAALFPSDLEESELGFIPRGWSTKRVGDICESVFSGGTPDTRNPSYWGGEQPWFSSGETRNRVVVGTEKRITEAGIKNSSARSAKPGDILIASAGQGSTRGQTSFCEIETFINQSVVALRSRYPSWLFQNLSGRYSEMRMLSDSHSIRGSLTTKILSSMPLVVPSDQLCNAFESIARCMLLNQARNLRCAEVLVDLRDALLPRLISGKPRLPEAQAIALGASV